jgi:hypothetical protein
MPEQTISPGVFTEERDQTFLQQGVQEIGGAFVGPTQKGPAFKPVEVQSPQGYEERFGDDGLYMDYSTKNYLRDASSATVVRLLGDEGYESEGVEIQLPQGELSKRPFEISKTEFSFDANTEPDEDIDVRVCFRGRQRRSDTQEILSYNISVHEYVDGKYNAEVVSEENVDLDCFEATFQPETDEYVPVYYEVVAELQDGQTVSIDSPTTQIEGFHLTNINYNWVDGKNKGEEEIVSLLGDVENIPTDNQGNKTNYSVEVYEVINGNLKQTPVAERSLNENRFRLGWVHGGSEDDRLTYVVKVTSRGVEDVPDSVSPGIDVITREETSEFKIHDVNWNWADLEDVDYGEKLQIDAEASQPVQSDALDVNDDGSQTEAQSGQNALNVVSGNPNDTSVYLEFQVGDSDIDVSTGDIISYILQLSDEESAGSAEEVEAESPEVVVDGGVFQIGEVETNFDEGDEVGKEQFSGVSFTVVNENSSATPFNYKVYEIINGDDESQIDSGENIGTKTVTAGFSNSTSFNNDVQYRIAVTQTATQSGSISSSDSQKTATQNVATLGLTDEDAVSVQEARFAGFDETTAEIGDLIFGDFAVDPSTQPGASAGYSYEVELYRNGTSTGQIVLASNSNADDRYFESWAVGDAGADLFDGDEFFYRFRVEDGDGNVDFVDSPTLTFSGQKNPNFGIDETDFQFADGEKVNLNERLAVYLETRRPSWPGDQYGLRYRVIGYVNGGSVGTVVADTLSEEGNETILQGNGTTNDPETDFEAGWFAGEDQTVSVGDTLNYELVIEQYDIATESVLQTDTVTSDSVTLAERTPKEDVTLAVLAPTERLRRDADEITDAQINPNKADINGFELILGLESTDTDGGGSTQSTSEGGDDDPVESLLSGTDDDVFTQDQNLLIDGKKYEVSLKEGESNYLLDLFGSNVESPTEVFAKASFPEVWEELIEEHYEGGGIDLKAEYDPAKFGFDGQEYSSAETPWIVSQDQQPNQPGANRMRLFKFETIGDGDYANTEVKASITNVRYPSEVAGSEYGEFDVLIRELGDTDRSPTILESFSGVNLNPDSQNYIARVIGNRKTILTDDGKLREQGGEAGVFENRSNYVRAVVHEQVVRANSGNRNDLANLVPWGFDPYQLPLDYAGQVPHGLKPRLVQSISDVDHDIIPEDGINPDISSASAPFDDRIFFGVDFAWEGNLSWLQAIAQNADSASDQSEFAQDYGFVLSDAYVENPDGNGLRQIEYGDAQAQGLPPERRKFNVAFQGGFDGMDPAKPQALENKITPTNSQGFDLSDANAAGSQAYSKAIDLLGNEDQFDINLLVTPGVLNSMHGAVIQDGIDMVESRSDTFYAFDAAGVEASVDDAVASVQSVDTSYAATYYPWLRIRDQNRNKQVRVPPSVLIPRVYAFNDQTAAEWYAPAGFERGGIPEAISAVVRLRKEDRDELYRNRVNPIAQFPDQGVSVWGQKTLQTQASALDRVNVRRLLIRVKKFIASTSRFLVFEQNVPETRNRFLNIVRPFLDQVQQQNGVFAFRVKMDAENNPPEVVDRNKLVGEIFLQPTRTAEFIELTFNVLPTGAEFEDV